MLSQYTVTLIVEHDATDIPTGDLYRLEGTWINANATITDVMTAKRNREVQPHELDPTSASWAKGD